MKKYIEYKIRVTENEYNFLKEMEKLSGLKRKDFILDSCKKQRGLFSNEQIYIIQRELNSIGININQVVKQLNKNIKINNCTDKDIEEIRKVVGELWVYLKSSNKILEIMLQ